MKLKIVFMCQISFYTYKEENREFGGKAGIITASCLDNHDIWFKSIQRWICKNSENDDD